MKKLFLFFGFILLITNVACSNTEEFGVDKKPDSLPPTTTAFPKGDIFPEHQFVTLNCVDNKSGCDVNKIYYSLDPLQDIDEFSWYNEIDKVSIVESATLRFFSVDYENNQEDIRIEKYVIDYPPEVSNRNLEFTISDNILYVRWNSAIDSITQSSKLKYKLYYAENNVLTTVENTLSVGSTEITKDWHNGNFEQFDTQIYQKTKEYYWQVLVKDSFGNISTYNTSQYSPESATIPKVTITISLNADLNAIVLSNIGMLNAYISVDGGSKQLMEITVNNTNATADIHFPDFSVTTHQFVVTYEYVVESPYSDTVLLAEVSTIQDFSNGQNELVLPIGDLVFTFDNDNDNINNISEILAGSNPNSFRWIWLSGSNTVEATGIYGQQGIAAATNVPGARSNSISWVDSNDNLWLFGGKGYDIGASG